MVKALIGFASLLVLAMVGLIVSRQVNRGDGASRAAVAEHVAVATISHGEAVDIDRHVVRTGLTLVEFTADF